MPRTDLAPRIDAVRRFNRFYTRSIGVLQEAWLNGPFSLTEARVLYELVHRQNATATVVRNTLDLDPGYLSRMLASFEKRGLIRKTPSKTDARQTFLAITGKGRRQFDPLDSRTNQQVRAMLQRLSESDQRRLLGAMQTIHKLLAPADQPNTSATNSYLLRPHQLGDMGWIVHRQGVLYGQEYGYDENYEALAAGIVAKFIQHYDPKRERCWIAERDGEVVGSVFLVAKSKTIAQLRLLYVEPSTRGLGIGWRLVSECVRFARQSGYKKMILWTQSELHAARHLYQRAGFRIAHRKRHNSFSRTGLVAEIWQLSL
jgi:DNA-binding MarR family transcriptional regulator/GNAT superfamily N-acetyltransferase